MYIVFRTCQFEGNIELLGEGMFDIIFNKKKPEIDRPDSKKPKMFHTNHCWTVLCTVLCDKMQACPRVVKGQPVDIVKQNPK